MTHETLCGLPCIKLMHEGELYVAVKMADIEAKIYRVVVHNPPTRGSDPVYKEHTKEPNAS